MLPGSGNLFAIEHLPGWQTRHPRMTQTVNLVWEYFEGLPWCSYDFWLLLKGGWLHVVLGWLHC